MLKHIGRPYGYCRALKLEPLIPTKEMFIRMLWSLRDTPASYINNKYVTSEHGHIFEDIQL